jgi:hypothetical protein
MSTKPPRAPTGKMPMGKLVAMRSTALVPPPPPTAPVTQQNIIGSATCNPQLVYSHPDASPVPHPSSFGAFASLIAMVDGDRTTYPLRKYRYVDYFITAMEMFVLAIQTDNKRQVEAAQKSGREHSKFTWGNKGELAICYTLTCDMLKILHDKLASPKPKWETLVEQLNHYLIRKSQIPTDILTEKTYHTKYLDWKKGGTRYNGEEQSNVRFPSAEERLKKLETRIRSGESYTVLPTVIEPTASAAFAPAAHEQSSAAVQSSISVRRPAAPVTPSGTRAKMPPCSMTSFKQPHEASRQFNWISELNSIKGSPNLLLLPRDRIDKMPLLINVCAKCDTAEQFCIVADLIAQSPVDVQSSFEALGGLVFIKRWLCSCLRMKNEAAVRTLAEKTVSMRLRSWSAKTRAAWHNGCVNLDWLRAAEFLGMRPQLWNETVLRLETLAMTPVEAELEAISAASTTIQIKRSREGDDVSLSAAGGQGSGAVNSSLTVRAVMLPEDLCFTVDHDAAAIHELIARRNVFAKNRQMALQNRIESRLRQRLGDDNRLCEDEVTPRIPSFFDPFSLLGVEAPLQEGMVS